MKLSFSVWKNLYGNQGNAIRLNDFRDILGRNRDEGALAPTLHMLYRAIFVRLFCDA